MEQELSLIKLKGEDRAHFALTGTIKVSREDGWLFYDRLNRDDSTSEVEVPIAELSWIEHGVATRRKAQKAVE